MLDGEKNWKIVLEIKINVFKYERISRRIYNNLGKSIFLDPK